MAGGSDAKRGHMAGRGSAKTWPHRRPAAAAARSVPPAERYIIDGRAAGGGSAKTCHAERYLIYMFCVRVDIT